MAEDIHYLDGIEFGRKDPSQLLNDFGFEDIQRLRTEHYRQEFSGRVDQEIDHYVGRLSLENWTDPNSTVGINPGQRRSDPLVSYAQRGGNLLGFAYFAQNVSSKIEPILDRLHVPEVVSSNVGEVERMGKLHIGKYYVWGSEHVEAAGHTSLAPLLVALGLEGYDPRVSGTWYPWAEEVRLQTELNLWGYQWDGSKKVIEGDRGFGHGAKATEQYRYVTSGTIDKIMHRIIYNAIGGQRALDYVHETMSD